MTSRHLTLLSFILGCSASLVWADRPQYSAPPYIISRAEARQRLLKFANTECPIRSGAREHFPTRSVFKRAISGDLDAMSAVFSACDYHEQSGDEYDGFSDRPWELLHSVGDRRFAAHLHSLNPTSRRAALQWILVVRDWYSWHPLADYDGYLRQHFPRVATIALSPAPARTPNHPLQPTAGAFIVPAEFRPLQRPGGG